MVKSLLYSKTGDEGLSSLLNGDRVLKSSPNFEAIGNIDELNCSLGVIIAYLEEKKDFTKEKRILLKTQSNLFSIGAILADPNYEEKNQFLADQIQICESLIDEFDEKVGALKNFIFPGGSIIGANLHLARSICRRAERSIINLPYKPPTEILQYINRLSDLLFALARYINFKLKKPEKIWRGQNESTFK